MRALNNHNVRLSAATLLALLLGGYLFGASADAAAASGDVTRTNGRIHVDSDERVGNVSSVNGSIFLAAGAEARRVRTVNGSIQLEHGTRVERAETVNGGIDVADEAEVTGNLTTVNGGIRLQNQVRVNGSVSAVNGGVRLSRGTRVSGEVSNVNGPLQLQQAEVGEDLVTSNGDVHLSDGSVVHGDLIFRKRGGWFQRWFQFHDDPELIIDGSSSVRGDIHLYRPVELRIDEDAQVGEILRHY